MKNNFAISKRRIPVKTQPDYQLPTFSQQMRLLSLLLVCVLFAGCGVYSFSGASVEGKTIRFAVLENRARNVVPSLASTLTEKIRSRILSQTGLTPVTGAAADADYDISGSITTYEYTYSSVNAQQAATNRLTIGIEIKFKNKLNPKADFTQTFSRPADYAASLSQSSVESQLIDKIGNDLADDVFNKAFVNW